MHEMSIVIRFADIAKEFAIKNNASKINKVVLWIGELTGAEPHYLEMFYPAVAEGTILEGSELVIETIEAIVFCTNCGKTYNPCKTELRCPDCQSKERDVIEGQSMIVKEIEIQ